MESETKEKLEIQDNESCGFGDKNNDMPPQMVTMESQEVKKLAREGIWRNFEQLPPNPAFSTPRVRCVDCGKERSLFLPWMRTHKQKCSARLIQQNSETSFKSRGTPGKPRDPVWSGFDTVPCNKEYSSSRVCCKTCGEQHSVFLPWMRQHKEQCEKQSSHVDGKFVEDKKVDSSAQTDKLNKKAVDTLAKTVHQKCEGGKINICSEEPGYQGSSSSERENGCNFNNGKTRPSRRERKMPTRFADSIVEDVVLQSLGIKEELEWPRRVELQQQYQQQQEQQKHHHHQQQQQKQHQQQQQQECVALKKEINNKGNDINKIPSYPRDSTFQNKDEHFNGENNFQAMKRPISEIDDGPGVSIKVFAVDSPLPRELHLTVQNSDTGLVEVQRQSNLTVQNSDTGLVEVQRQSNLNSVHNNADISHVNEPQSPRNVKIKVEESVLTETELNDDKQKVKMGFMCSKCCNIFLVKEELKEHLYKCRNVKPPRSVRARPTREYKCSKCSRQFLSKHSLNRHSQRSVCTKIRSKKSFTCPSCERKFRDNFALTTHIKACGKRTGGPRQRAVCLHPSCDLRFMHVKAMMDHVRQAHQDVHIDIQEYTFLNLEDFIRWKDIEEAKTMTRYVKNGVRDGGVSLYRSYDCIHNGEDKNKVRLTNRVHGKGKIKIGLFCPARMQTRILKDGTVSVTFIATHTHEISLQQTQHHRLAKSTVKYIKQQLAVGVPERKIQESLKIGFIDPEVREANGDLIKRRHIVSLTQIVKIGKKMNMQPINSQINPEDIRGVELLVKRLEGEAFNPIITYKAPGAPVTIGALELDHLPHANSLFALGIQTQQQLDIMRGGDTSVLCVDTTYCKKQCDIFLISVIIPDLHGKGGYPVAHFITNHQDQITLHYMFSSLKERYPSLKVGAILTDGNKSGYNALQGLTRVFGSTHHLICHAYLTKLWKWRLKMSAKNERSLQIEVMSFLTALMKEENLDFFQELCQSFAEKYGNVIAQFVNSFTKSFLSKSGQKVEQWAKCYRRVLGYSIESIPYCKELQDKLKFYFKNQIATMRIHDLVALLLDFWNNIQVENVNEYIQANAANEMEQVWESEPFLDTIFHSEDLKTTTEALEDLEKLRGILQEKQMPQQQTNSNSNNSNSNQSLLKHTAATLKQLLQQWEQVTTTDSDATVVVSTPHHNAHMHMGNTHTQIEANTAVKHIMGNY